MLLWSLLMFLWFLWLCWQLHETSRGVVLKSASPEDGSRCLGRFFWGGGRGGGRVGDKTLVA